VDGTLGRAEHQTSTSSANYWFYGTMMAGKSLGLMSMIGYAV
jgi:hypothetical protein